eukprot:INCI448.1.p1 GENE.INCI448.1~~INCI448.1.p1  ORF type:complete len:467 (-),score=55.92 INCI448.1:101-1501(-)
MRKRSSRVECSAVQGAAAAIAAHGSGTSNATASWSRRSLAALTLLLGCSTALLLPVGVQGLEPYPDCEEDFACSPECSDLCRNRPEATDTSPNCWGTENWMCGPFSPESTRNNPSCTYAWYTTGEIWGAEQFSIIDADREKVFCTNICPYGYFIVSPNLEDGEVPLLTAPELQEIIIAEQGGRRQLGAPSAVAEHARLGDDGQDLGDVFAYSPLGRALQLVERLRSPSRALSSKCDLETVNSCSQDYLDRSTAEKLSDCQTIWDLWYCIDDLNCGEDFDETLADTQELISVAGCTNYSYQPRDDCDEDGAQACVDNLDAETCTGISTFRVCMQDSGCITPDAYDSDFEELMATLDELDDLCEFECRGCDEGCRSPLWCMDYYGCAKCNSSASLWTRDGTPYTCLSQCPSGYADENGVCEQCIGIVEDGVCLQISEAAGLGRLPLSWATITVAWLATIAWSGGVSTV